MRKNIEAYKKSRAYQNFKTLLKNRIISRKHFMKFESILMKRYKKRAMPVIRRVVIKRERLENVNELILKEIMKKFQNANPSALRKIIENYS